MSRKKAVLRIKLKSDLCVGSGYSYEGVVDTDICCNKNGIPYIPGRRLKGCLREAAEMIRMKESQMASVFGVGGNDILTGVQVGNAFPEGYEFLDDELSALKASKSEFCDYLSQQNVLDYYSHINAQTKIDECTGTAQEDTLRFTRVVNQYVNEEELNFLAPLTFDCDKEELEKAVKALRHMGTGRNRGLGNVMCSLEKIEDEEALPMETYNGNQTEPIVLKVVLNNIQPLMLSMNNDSKTEKYISGQSLLGALAGAYIRNKGYKNRQEASKDPVFRELFLDGTTSYSNFYVSRKKGKEFVDYVPAPQFVKMLKKTKVFVNAAADIVEDASGDISYENDEKYETKGGNIPKKLNGKFVHIEGNRTISVAEPVTEIVYHHSHGSVYEQDRSQEEEKGIFYAMEVLEKGQFFSGTIKTIKKYEKILKLLLSQDLYLGKSRTAEYGLCVTEGECKTIPDETKYRFSKGDEILVVLESDGIFIGDYGYTVRYDEVRNKIAKDLNITYREKEKGFAALESKMISGYNTMWNLKKPSIPAISAGSVFSYTLEADCEIETDRVGEKNLEGYGRVWIYNTALLKNTFQECPDEVQENQPKEVKEMLIKILKGKLMAALTERAFDMEDMKISASTLGRLTLMLEESLNLHRDSYMDAFEDLKKRVLSISRMKEKNVILKCMAKCLGGKIQDSKFKPDDGSGIILALHDAIVSEKNGKKADEVKKIYDIMKKVYGKDSKRLEEDVNALWGKYFMQILICQKYKMAEMRG